MQAADPALIDAALEGQPEAVLRLSKELIGRGRPDVASMLRQATGVTRGRLPTPRTALDAMAETGLKPIPFVGAIESAADTGRLWAASRRMEFGTASPEDEKLVLGFVEEERRKEAKGATTGYYAMRILTELTGFLGEIASTGGLYTAGRKGAEKAAATAAGKAVRQSIERVAGKTAASLAIKAAGATAGSALQAAANVPRVVGATLQRAMPTWATTEDEAGEAALVLVEGGKSFMRALPEGYADTLIEYVSERAGAGIAQVPGISRLVALQGRILEKLSGGSKAKLGALLKQVGSEAGWHGVIAEMGEERFASVLRAAVLDDPWEDVFPGKEQLLGEAIAFSVPGVAAAGAQRIAKAGAAVGSREGEPAPVETDETASATRQAGADAALGVVPEAPPEPSQFSPAAAPAPSPERQRARDAAVSHFLGSQDRQGEVVEPSSPIQKAIAQAVTERGGDPLFVRASDRKPFDLPAMTDARTGAVVFDAAARPEEMQRAFLRHEVLAHLLKGQDQAAWQGLYDEARAADPEGMAEAEAGYVADFARITGRTMSPDAASEEGLGRTVESLSRWMDAVASKPGRVEALLEKAEGRSMLQRLVEALKRALSRLTGGRVQSARQELDALDALLGGPEGMSLEDKARVAGSLNRAWSAMQRAKLPALEAVSEAQEAPQAPQWRLRALPGHGRDGGAHGPGSKSGIQSVTPESAPATRPQPSAPAAESPLTPKQRRLAERRANKARGQAEALRAAPARTSVEAREQLRRARELEAKAPKPTRGPVTRRPLESRQAMAERLSEEGREDQIRFAVAPVEREFTSAGDALGREYHENLWAYRMEGGEPVELGRLTVAHHEDGTASVLHVEVPERFRRQGHARALYREFARRYPDKDLGTLGARTAEGQAMREALEREGTIRGREEDQIRFAAAYHGTGAEFDEFSDEKIGTGEGAQAYGYGHYFAGKREVAEHYRKMAEGESWRWTSNTGLPFADVTRAALNGAWTRAGREAAEQGGAQAGLDAAKRDLESQIARHPDSRAVEAQRMALKAIEEGAVDVLPPVKGRLLQVDLAPSEDEYLLWDEPLSGQSEKVKAALESTGLLDEPGIPTLRGTPIGGGDTGADLYRALVGQFTTRLGGESGIVEGSVAQRVSAALRAAGIRGIKYLDGSSRGKGEGSYNYVIFDPKDVKITARFAVQTDQGARVEIGGLAGTPAVASTRSWLKHNLTSQGNMPESAFRSLIERDARVAVAMQGVRYGLRDFRRAARKVYGRDVPYKQLDEALKNSEAMQALPEEIRGPLQSMRSDIDALSRAMIASGAVEGALVARIEENLGFYATRSYRVFDDPKWSEKVPPEVRNKAKAFLRAEYQGRARRARELALENPERADALNAVADRMEQRATEPYIEGLIGSLLYEGKAAQTMFGLLAGSKVGAKDLSILKRRKTIAPEIRALFGEYEDPTVNYARSITKMGHLIANHQFLADVEAAGRSEGWLTEEPVGENVARIAADESQVMHPLNGLYTTREIEQAFKDLDRESMPEWLRYYLRINGAVKYAKTVGSVITQVRNFTGNLGFILANGHYRIGHTRDAFRSVLTRFAGSDKAWRERYQDALRHGVIHESANAGELRDVLQDAMKRDLDSVLLTQATPIQKGIGLLTDVYSANDDFWKLYAWQNEMDAYRVAHPDWSEEKIKTYTAEIVRNTFPTYSLVPRMVKKLRRFPLVGSFVSFPSEVVRTAKNTIGQAAKELRDPATKAIGARRVAGMVLAATSTAGAAAASRFLTGMSGDDDEDARQFVPPWSKNSDLLWLGGNGQNPLYVDASYTDPYSYLKAPLKAFLRGEDWQEKVVGALAEATEPWIGEEILAGGILDVLRNKKRSGGDVYNDAADPTTQAQEIAEHLWRSLQPGTIGSIDRIAKGLTGRVSPYGKAYDPKIEALATLSGVRVTELDVKQSLRFRALDFQRQMSGATRMLSKVTRREGAVSEGEVARAYASMEESRKRHFRDMRRAVEAAQKMGLSRQEIVRELRESLSAENAALLLRGTYVPYKPSRMRNERDRQVVRLYRERIKETRP